MTKSGPKEDKPAHPVTEEKKAAWQLRMKRLGINQSQLAKKLGVTRAAVTHLFKAAKQSSLVPQVESILQYGPPPPPGVPAEKWYGADEESRSRALRESPLFSERGHESYQGSLGAVRDPHKLDVYDSHAREIVHLLAKLTDANRDKLVDYARVIYEAQQKQIKKNALPMLLDVREREAREQLSGAEEMLAMYNAKIAELETAIEMSEAENKTSSTVDAMKRTMELRRVRNYELTRAVHWQNTIEAATRDLENIAEMRKQAAKISKSRKDDDDFDGLRRVLKLRDRKS